MWNVEEFLDPDGECCNCIVIFILKKLSQCQSVWCYCVLNQQFIERQINLRHDQCIFGAPRSSILPFYKEIHARKGFIRRD